MLPHSSISDTPPFNFVAEFPQMAELVGRHNVPPFHMKPLAPEEYVDMARYEMDTVLRYWGYRPEMWTIIGFTAPAADRFSAVAPVAHPIVEMMQSPVVVRRQALSLSERDVIARHAFTQYLTAQGLPVPKLLSRPDGSTYAIAPVVPLTDPLQASGFTYLLENAIYEIQSYVPGRRFVTDGSSEDTYLEAAAQALAELHRASSSYAGPTHRWPPERAALPLAQLYLSQVVDISRSVDVSRTIATGLRRLARETGPAINAAGAHLEAHPGLPAMHIHGDYQPHNLAFDGGHVRAIYDFDATHWDWRILELAYALAAFTGLRWEDDAPQSTPSPTPPLAERGLDLERARAFLSAYGRLAPPEPGEADLLADALLLVFPVIFANGIAENFVSSARDGRSIQSQRESRAQLEWGETFPSWVESQRALLRDAWR